MSAHPTLLSLPEHSAEMAARLAAGEVVALPTDTVPGLAARLDLPEAIEALRALKGSSDTRPYSWHLPSLRAIKPKSGCLPAGLPAWLPQVLPSGVTVVLPSHWLTLPCEWSWPAVGLRLPAHEGFYSVAEICGGPLAMTSINDAGEPPLQGQAAVTWAQEHGLAVAGIEEPDANAEKRQASSVLRVSPEWEWLRNPREEPFPRPGKRILVLCSGNICRSPVAEGLFRRDIAKSWGVEESVLSALGWEIRSAGTLALSGGPASEHSVSVASARGVDLADHQSWSLQEALEQEWDLILGMGPQHLQGLSSKHALSLLSPQGQAIADPFGGSLQDYEQMAQEVEESVAMWVRKWSAWEPN